MEFVFNIYIYVILNGFRGSAISQCSSKAVNKKEILRSVCLVQYISGNSTVNIRAVGHSCGDMARCSSVQ
jgi:hypothetical protein